SYVDPDFGMNTRLTGSAVHDRVGCWTQSASSAFWEASNATLPSTPAVLRPALTSATRRTLSRAFDRERRLGRTGARCWSHDQSVSPVRPPHPACPSQGTGRSTCLTRWSAREGGCRFRGPWGRDGVTAV